VLITGALGGPVNSGKGVGKTTVGGVANSTEVRKGRTLARKHCVKRLRRNCATSSKKETNDNNRTEHPQVPLLNNWSSKK